MDFIFRPISERTGRYSFARAWAQVSKRLEFTMADEEVDDVYFWPTFRYCEIPQGITLSAFKSLVSPKSGPALGRSVGSSAVIEATLSVAHRQKR